MQEEAETLSDVKAAFQRVRNDGQSVLFRLTSGIVLRCKPVPPIYLRALAEQLAPPPPPQVRIERGDDSYYEENRDDPEWQRTLAELAGRTNVAVTRLMLGMGTEIAEIPEGMFGPESDEWIKQVRRADKFTGVETPLDLDDEDMRYISWLSFYAINNVVDLELAALFPQFLAGPTEVEIAQAVDAFRDLRTGRAVTGSLVDLSGGNGNKGNRASRRRSA